MFNKKMMSSRRKRVNHVQKDDVRDYVPHILSPASGKAIMVGGPAFKELERLGYTRYQLLNNGVFMNPRPRRRTKKPSPIRKIHGNGVMNLPLYDIPSLEETLRGTKQPALRHRLKKQIRRQDEGRGAGTRGWKARAPRKGRPRHRLKRECGDDCFLMPEKEGFPICPKCLKGEPCRCELDCGGVLSAKIRARQLGYDNVAQLSDQILSERCGGK